MTYSTLEEFFSALIHGIGALLSSVMLTILIVCGKIYGSSILVITTSIIFGVSMMLMFLTSMFYHSVTDHNLKMKIKRIDHIVIYYLIAGTYTPFCLVSLGGISGWVNFVIIWGLAVLGTMLKIIIPITKGIKFWSIGLYLLMGWIGIFSFHWFIKCVPHIGLFFLVTGGLCYTVGVVFYALKKIRFTHAIWHLFVLGGAIMHFFAVLYSCILL